MPSTVLLILLCVAHAGMDGAPAGEQQSNEGGHAAAEAIQSAQRASQAPPTENIARLAVSVNDENGVVVPAAQILLSYRDVVFRGETDLAGRFDIRLRPGLYEIRVEREGFYVFHRTDLVVAQSEQLAVTLNHFQEFSDQTEVVYSPPAVDPAKTAGSETLTTREIVNLPYTTSRDFRNLLPMIPGVVRDPSGQIHVNGSAAHQIFNQLDGFNITHPVSGALEMRLSVDALRQIEVQGTRHSAEYGKGSGGAVGLTTGMGDDHFSFSATNFLPGVKAHSGLRIDDWTPRATFSGPLRKGKAWFFNAADGETHLNILKELPPGQDENRTWRFNNLAKVQVNLSPSNILTASVLANKFRSLHAGLSRFSPIETTRIVDRSAYLFTLKDQILFSRGLVVNLGFAVNTFNDNLSPLGRLPYVIRPNGNSGNFFKRERSDVRRVQWIADIIFQPLQWRGRHEFKVGMDAARVLFRQDLDRTPILVYRQDGTLSRRIEFFGAESLRRNISEVSGWLQERWWPAGWLLVEIGMRSDWDQVMRQAALSPRFAATGTLPGGKTKFSSGVGIFRDATNLSFITRPSEGRRVDSFYSAETQTRPLSMVETRFEVNEKLLRSPRFVNWSIGLEQMLPGSVYSHLEFIQKRGSQGLTFVNADSSSDAKAFYALRNIQRDRFDSIQFTVKKNVEKYGVMSSYTRSWARSNAVIDFSLDEPVFARQSGGALPWDVPHRLLSWGWLPLVRKYDFAYLLEWRSGFPYSFVNEEQRLVGSVNAQRLPSFFSLNLHVERRFTLSGYQWALRAGSNNVTNHKNPSVINNNIDSAEFLKFGGVQDRVFTARIRFLGRK